MNIENITNKDIFELLTNRCDESRARIIRRACVHCREVRKLLFDYSENASAIYQQAVHEFMSDLTPQVLSASHQAIVEAYREDATLPGDDYLIKDVPGKVQGGSVDPVAQFE